MLLPCGSCQRHIKHNEATCPFCGVACESNAKKVLQRAASIAAVGVALTLTACPRDIVPVATKYGGPPPPTTEPTSTSQPASQPDSDPDHRPVAEYGAPSPRPKPKYGGPPLR